MSIFLNLVNITILIFLFMNNIQAAPQGSPSVKNEEIEPVVEECDQLELIKTLVDKVACYLNRHSLSENRRYEQSVVQQFRKFHAMLQANECTTEFQADLQHEFKRLRNYLHVVAAQQAGVIFQQAPYGSKPRFKYSYREQHKEVVANFDNMQTLTNIAEQLEKSNIALKDIYCETLDLLVKLKVFAVMSKSTTKDHYKDLFHRKFYNPEDVEKCNELEKKLENETQKLNNLPECGEICTKLISNACGNYPSSSSQTPYISIRKEQQQVDCGCATVTSSLACAFCALPALIGELACVGERKRIKARTQRAEKKLVKFKQIMDTNAKLAEQREQERKRSSVSKPL